MARSGSPHRTRITRNGPSHWKSWRRWNKRSHNFSGGFLQRADTSLADVFGANAHAYRPRHQALEARNAYRHLQLPWRLRRAGVAEQSIERFVRDRLDALRHTRRKFAAALHLGKNIFG